MLVYMLTPEGDPRCSGGKILMWQSNADLCTVTSAKGQ